MSKVVFLGDSLMAMEDNNGHTWVQRLSTELGMNHVSLAVPAGNNVLQCVRLENYILSDDYHDDDIFAWELNTITRSNILIPDQFRDEAYKLLDKINLKQPGHKIHNILHSTNTLFNKSFLFLLCHNIPEVNEFRQMLDPHGIQHNPIANLHRTIAMVKMLSRLHKVVIFLGWESSIGEYTCTPDKLREIFDKTIESIPVEYIKTPLLDWCVQNRLPMFEDFHPTADSCYHWATSHLSPVLERFTRTQ